MQIAALSNISMQDIPLSEIEKLVYSTSTNLSNIANSARDLYLQIPLDGSHYLLKDRCNSLWQAISAFSYKLGLVSSRCSPLLLSKADSIQSFFIKMLKQVEKIALSTTIPNDEKFDKLSLTFNEAVFEIAKIIAK